MALLGQTRDVLAGLFVPLGESEEKTCSVERQAFAYYG